MKHFHHLLSGPLLLASLVMLSVAVSRAADMEGRAKVEGNKLVCRDQGQTLVIEGGGTTACASASRPTAAGRPRTGVMP